MDRCQEKILHVTEVKHAVDNLPAPDALQTLTEMFKALGDPNRLKIVIALATCELCVCDLAAVCGASESSVSHQLRILRNLKIVRYRRDGKVVFYRLDDDHVNSIIRQSLAHVTEQGPA